MKTTDTESVCADDANALFTPLASDANRVLRHTSGVSQRVTVALHPPTFS